MLVKRIWEKDINIKPLSNHILHVWDGGSRKFERWPNGVEHSWEVESRELTETGFIETLRELSLWETPTHVKTQEQLQLLGPTQYSQGLGELLPVYYLPGWSVRQEISLEEPCYMLKKVLEHASVKQKHDTLRGPFQKYQASQGGQQPRPQQRQQQHERHRQQQHRQQRQPQQGLQPANPKGQTS